MSPCLNRQFYKLLKLFRARSLADTSQQIKDANVGVIQLLKDTQGAVNTSQLKNVLITKFAGFDESKLGFKTFSEFLAAITEVKLSKIGTVNYASLQKIKPEIKIENQKQSSAEYYLSLLNKHNMRLVSADKIKIIYKQSTLIKDSYTDLTSLKEAVYAATSKIDGQLSKTDINKVFNIFVRMSLIHNEKEKGGINAIKVKKIALKDFLIQIDKLIITTLIELCKVNAVEIKAKEIKKITLSSISKDNIKKFIEEK